MFAQNVEMFHWLTNECDKRGIWLVQMFYNIFLPKPLADKHGISTQLAAPTPLASDYTRKSIAEFVKQYPNVGLMSITSARRCKARRTRSIGPRHHSSRRA